MLVSVLNLRINTQTHTPGVIMEVNFLYEDNNTMRWVSVCVCLFCFCSLAWTPSLPIERIERVREIEKERLRVPEQEKFAYYLCELSTQSHVTAPSKYKLTFSRKIQYIRNWWMVIVVKLFVLDNGTNLYCLCVCSVRARSPNRIKCMPSINWNTMRGEPRKMYR